MMVWTTFQQQFWGRSATPTSRVSAPRLTLKSPRRIGVFDIAAKHFEQHANPALGSKRQSCNKHLISMRAEV